METLVILAAVSAIAFLWWWWAAPLGPTGPKSEADWADRYVRRLPRRRVMSF